MSSTIEKSSGKTEKAVRKKIDELGDELGYLQRKCRELGIPVLIIVEGLSAAGKGTLINRIIQPLDPRGFKVSCIASPIDLGYWSLLGYPPGHPHDHQYPDPVLPDQDFRCLVVFRLPPVPGPLPTH